MRYLMWVLTSMFCKHDWEREEIFCHANARQGLKVSATCKECGWHRSYWKY